MSSNPADVDLVLAFRAASQDPKKIKQEAKEAESQYVALLSILARAGFKAVGRRGKELGHILVLIQCPDTLLQNLLKKERSVVIAYVLKITDIC